VGSVEKGMRIKGDEDSRDRDTADDINTSVHADGRRDGMRKKRRC